MFGDIFRRMKGQGPERLGTRLARRMGGDPSQLTPMERKRLDETTEAVPLGDDVNALLNHISEHGSAVLGEQLDLLNKAGAFDASHAKADARQAAYDALWATDVPVPSEGQLDILESLPSAELQSFLSTQCRTALVFEPDIRPATVQDLTFAGGLPVVSGAFQWPMDTRRKGEQVPCQFMGQINCADLPDFALRHLFPKTGALVFFLAQGKADAPLVQHCALEDPKEVPPPFGLRTNDSYYDETLYGQMTSGWPHEAALGVPRHSVSPKFPLIPRLLCQAPRHSWFAELPVEVPEDLLHPFDGCTWRFLEDHHEALNRVGGSVRPERDEGAFTARGFDGFPHLWGSVARLLERVEIDLTRTQAFYEDRIAANSGREAEMQMAACWKHEGAEEQAAEVMRTHGLLDQLHATRAILSDWTEKATALGATTPVPQAERVAFWRMWDNMLADTENFALEDRWNQSVPVNAAHVLDRMIRKEATLGAIAGLSSQANDLTAETSAWVRPYLQSRHGATRYPHIQSLGHAASTDSEAPFIDILLMQFPRSELFDWYIGDDGAAQFWLSQHDFQTGGYEKARLEVT